jgi:hypothetical protein
MVSVYHDIQKNVDWDFNNLMINKGKQYTNKLVEGYNITKDFYLAS